MLNTAPLFFQTMTCGNMNHLNHWYINHLKAKSKTQALSAERSTSAEWMCTLLKHPTGSQRRLNTLIVRSSYQAYMNLYSLSVPYLFPIFNLSLSCQLRPQNSNSASQHFLVCYASYSEEESLAVSAPRYFLSKPQNLPRQDSGKKVSRILKVQQLKNVGSGGKDAST